MAAAGLTATVRRELAKVADPERARGAQAYLKSAMPLYGVAMPAMRAIAKRLLATYDFGDEARFRHDVLSLWRGAKMREERYVAIELADHRRAVPLQVMAMLPVYEEMIVTGAWWDLVDPIASHLLDKIHVREGVPMKKAMRAWSKDADMWKRRSAILLQIRRKDETDLDLLYACIEPSIGRKEFFLRKAIGWALRSYAWTDPGEVARWVKANEDRLSPLSVREALKNVSAPRPSTRRPAGTRSRRPSSRS
jgi:3-methyladenine DNA glycosylase AlkD